MWYDAAQAGLQKERGWRVGGYEGRFLVVWWILMRGKLDSGYILWQLYCLTKLKIRFSLVASVLLSYHPTWSAFLPVSSWSNSICLKRANIVAEKEVRTCHLNDNEWQHSLDTMATQGILVSRAHDESGPWCSLLPIEDSRGREIKDTACLIQESFTSFIYEMKIHSKSGFRPYWELISCSLNL